MFAKSENRKAHAMSPMLGNLRVLILSCVPIVLAGCQSAVAPSVAGPHFAMANHPLIEVKNVAPARKAMPSPALVVKAAPCVLKSNAPVSAKPKDESPVADAQKDQGCLTVELGDALLLVFKSCTGR
jgi:hypothetical protein